METTGQKPTKTHGRPMKFITTDEGCFVCMTHKRDGRGYLRKTWNRKDEDSELFHRFIYRARKGPIPEGYEIDHICRNKLCCNPEHLQALSVSDHRAKTNTERSEDKRIPAIQEWEHLGRPRPSVLAHRYGHKIYRWIREHKRKNDLNVLKENQETLN